VIFCGFRADFVTVVNWPFFAIYFRQMGMSPAIHLWTIRYGNDVATILPL